MKLPASRQSWTHFSFVVAFACFAAPVFAQRGEMEAIPGEPFGVAAVTVPATTGGIAGAIGPWLTERDGRAFYPAFSAGGLVGLLAGEETGVAASGKQTVFFLFTGNAPLQLTIHAPTPVPVVLVPGPQPPRIQNRLLQRWWRAYNDDASALSGGDYPPLIQQYLAGMLGRRLGLKPPLLTRLRQDKQDDWQQLVDLLMGTERLHDAVLRETMAGPRDVTPATVAVPEEVAWRPPVIPDSTTPPLEPMASHVPEECFYVRFGTFENYLWLESLLNSYGGDIGRMVTARGQQDHSGERIRTQLATPQTALTKVFGPSVIADISLIGRDLYLKNGAAVGVLLQARNTSVLKLSLGQQRSAALAAEKARGATLETIKILDKEVSFLSTPDHRLRSFHVVDGDFHLITNSRRLVERFLESGSGKSSLAQSPEFHYARLRYPLDRDDTIFSFLSTSFLAGLLTPQYQVELFRRTQSLVDLEVVELARRAALGEGIKAESIDDLVAAGFVPPGFGVQPDGSGVILEESRAIDSLRGARGTFLPIPDVEIKAATPAEALRFNSLAQNYFSSWKQLDPVMVAIRREKVADKRERMVIEANVSPLAEEKYGWLLSVLGPPVTQHVVPRAGDVISAQAYVTGGQLSSVVPPHLLFVGIQDLPVDGNLSGKGWLYWLRVLRTTPGYLGAWPKPGFIDWLPLGQAGVPPFGLSRLPFDLWRWQADAFSVLSFQPSVLESIAPQLIIADAPDTAQIRLQVGDLEQTRLRDWVQSLYYGRAWQTSIANPRLLQALSQQLRVPPAEARQVAESLLDTRLICPLGGEYEVAELPGGRQIWRSTAWESPALRGPGVDRGAVAVDEAIDPANGPPAGYRAPLLTWFRGLQMGLTKSENQVTIHAEIDMER